MPEEDAAPEVPAETTQEQADVLSEVQAPMKKKDREVLLPALNALVDWVVDRGAEVDVQVVDAYITEIERRLQAQVNEVLHHPKFQVVESAWRGLDLLVQRTDFMADDRVIIEVLNVDKETLRADLEAHPGDMYHTDLYHTLYDAGYNVAGGHPYGTMIGAYEFENTGQDIQMLSDLGSVARAAHCPFIASTSSKSWRTVLRLSPPPGLA